MTGCTNDKLNTENASSYHESTQHSSAATSTSWSSSFLTEVQDTPKEEENEKEETIANIVSAFTVDPEDAAAKLDRMLKGAKAKDAKDAKLDRSCAWGIFAAVAVLSALVIGVLQHVHIHMLL